MSLLVFVLGPSGEGKSRSLVNMDPESTIIVNADEDPLPHKQLVRNFIEGKNLFHTSKLSEIETVFDNANKNPKIKAIAIDTWSRIMTNMRMSNRMRVSVDPRKEWNSLAERNYDVMLTKAKKLRPDLIVYLISHVESDILATDDGFSVGKVHASTQGQLLKKMFPESFSSIVLYTYVDRIPGLDPKFYFSTIPMGNNTCKTPEGMFEEKLIPNDLAFVDTSIREYYNL